MTLTLTPRPGPRPRTSERAIPHQQLDQTAPREVYDRLVERFVAMPRTTNGPSLISVPGARALFLACDEPCNEHAFFRGREFAHVHPPFDGSFHMILSARDCDQVVAAGWGELHPLAIAGLIQRTTVMVYAPRDEAEIEIVLAIAQASQRFAMTPIRGA